MPMENALSGIAGIDRCRRRSNAGGTANITVRFVLERDLDDAANSVREKVAGAMRNVPPRGAAAGHPESDPDADPIMSLVALVEDDEPAHADRDRRQAGEARARVGRRRRRRHAERRPPARNSHRRRHREAERARPVDRSGARRDLRRRTSRFPAARSSRASGKSALRTLGRIDATDQFNNIIVATRQRHAGARSSDIGYAEDSVERADSRRCGSSDGSPAVQLDIRRASGENTIKVIEAREAEARVGAADAAEGGHADDHAATTRGSSTRRSRRSRSTCSGAASSRRSS